MKKLVPALVVAFTLGLVVGRFGYGGALPSTESGPDPESPPYSLSTSGGDCLEPRSHARWVHEVAVGDSFAVSLNATVVHGRNRTVTTNVSRVAPGTYRIDLRTVLAGTEATSDEMREVSSSEDCVLATDLRLGASPPTDYRQLEVAVNGRGL